VFNHRNFWNGRAQPDFNGVNPFGSRDTTVRVWTLDYRGSPIQVYINIKDASLASQAVGPPLNTVEMSA
jgi:cytochrome c peroxidase